MKYIQDERGMVIKVQDGYRRNSMERFVENGTYITDKSNRYEQRRLKYMSKTKGSIKRDLLFEKRQAEAFQLREWKRFAKALKIKDHGLILKPGCYDIIDPWYPDKHSKPQR